MSIYSSPFLINSIANLFSLILFLLLRHNRLFSETYNKVIKYAWATQLFVFVFPDLFDSWARVILAYGFFWDYMVLEVSPSAGVLTMEDIAFRAITNLIHHMTMFHPSTFAQRVAYFICWTTHLFPWLQLTNKMIWFRPMVTVGNFAPAALWLWLQMTGQYDVLPMSEKGSLVMMVIYRSIYINCLFHGFSYLGIATIEQENAWEHVAKKCAVGISLFVAFKIFVEEAI